MLLNSISSLAASSSSSRPTQTKGPNSNYSYVPLAMAVTDSRFGKSDAYDPYGTNVSVTEPSANETAAVAAGLHQLEASSVHWYSYFTTLDFWVVVLLGQVLALCITGTNTFSTFLVNAGTSIPALQTLFNYVLLALIYLPICLYHYGPRRLGRVI